MNVPESEKIEVVNAAREALTRWAENNRPHLLSDFSGMCLHHAVFLTREIFLRYKTVALMVAGSMSWPITPEDDDGVSATHFSYQFETKSVMNILAMLKGDLPEMHVWVYIPAWKVMVDTSTKYFREFVNKHHPDGVEWKTPSPPDFIWCPVENLHKLHPRVVYLPHAKATRIACSAASRLFPEVAKEMREAGAM